MGKNKPIAVALKYDDKRDNAPIVSARGTAAMANKMKQVARRYGVPIAKEQKLVSSLEEIKLDQEIPPTLYHDVSLLFKQIKNS